MRTAAGPQRPPWALGRFAPGGSPISARALCRVFAGGNPYSELCTELAQRVTAGRVTLHASGREALRVALHRLADRSGRHEVVVPAYVCFSVPAAAVAAGLAVRLVDVDESGRLDPESLARLPLEKAAAVVVANLFGLPEPVAEVLGIARSAGAAVVDDAAQALGARSVEGPAGGRGDVGVLSFGRGKPLSALGGGALAWPSARDASETTAPVAAHPVSAAGRALAYDLARRPLLLGLLARIPALGIGETVYDPGFQRGAIPGAALALARALLPDLAASARERAAVALALAEALRGDTPYRPLTAASGDTAVYPRLGVLAPDAAGREHALAALRPFGASPLYPTTLAHIEALAPHLVGERHCPGAEELSRRILTLPTHAAVRARIGAIAARLRAAHARRA